MHTSVTIKEVWEPQGMVGIRAGSTISAEMSAAKQPHRSATGGWLWWTREEAATHGTHQAGACASERSAWAPCSDAPWLMQWLVQWSVQCAGWCRAEQLGALGCLGMVPL